jgi:hypothetical protein
MTKPTFSPSYASFKPLIMLLVGAFIVLGSVSAFIVPPFQNPDENAHWTAGLTRSYWMAGFEIPPCTRELALGSLFPREPGDLADQARVPAGLYAKSFAFEGGCKPNPVYYGSAISYPAVTVALMGKWVMGSQPIHTFLLARLLSGALVSLCLILFARQALASSEKVPMVASLVVTAFFLSPIALQQSFAVSTDCVFFSAATLLSSYLMTGKTWTRVDWIVFGIVATVAIATLPVLIPFLLSAALFFRERFTMRVALLGALALGGLALVVVDSPIKIAKDLQQLSQRPVETIWLWLSESIGVAFDIGSWIGRLGWLDYVSSQTTLVLYYVVLASVVGLSVFAYQDSNVSAKRVEMHEPPNVTVADLLFVVCWLVSLILTAFCFYGVAAKSHASTDLGLQGRLFVPHLVLLAVFLLRFTERRSWSDSRSLVVLSWARENGHLFIGWILLCYSVSRSMDTLVRYW